MSPDVSGPTVRYTPPAERTHARSKTTHVFAGGDDWELEGGIAVGGEGMHSWMRGGWGVRERETGEGACWVWKL